MEASALTGCVPEFDRVRQSCRANETKFEMEI
jgi:hypothetical protein